MSDRTIIAVSAGLGQPSSTRLLADRLTEATAAELHRRDLTATVEVLELRELAHEIVNTMLTGFSTGALREALDKVTAADGLVAVTPVFNSSYSGLFKSFVDVLDPQALEGKPVLLGGTGGTARHSLALEYAMRPLFAYLRADVTPTAVFAATGDWAGEDDQVTPLPARISRAARELAELVAARQRPDQADPYAGTPSFQDMLKSL